MTVRPEIRKLAELGRFPLEKGATEEQITMYETALQPIEGPVSDTFGLAWQLVHLIETAPGWPIADVLDSDPTNEWIAHLRQTVENSGHASRARAYERASRDT